MKSQLGPRPVRHILFGPRLFKVFALLSLFLVISTAVFCDFAVPIQRKLTSIFPYPQKLVIDWSNKETINTGSDPLIYRSESIYVLSLPRRTDRRTRMESLRTYLGLNWTYINATSAEEEVVGQILMNVERLRAEAMHDESEYFTQFLTNAESNTQADGSPSSNLQLVGATKDFTLAPYSPDLPYHRFLTPARVAVWHSHLKILKQIVAGATAAGNDQEKHISIILEDDIDMEKDIRRRLRQVWDFLPNDWDVVFLGHCWSNESTYPAIHRTSSHFAPTHNSLHPSHSPRCTHAYALSPSGASRLVALLEYPPFAYSRAIDQAYAWLVMSGRINAYSVVPSVAVQVKTGIEGNGDVWRPGGSEGNVSSWKEELSEGVLRALVSSMHVHAA
ncbi:hypothetical protein GYMLUDRAFT_180534 [Collybiopsis luxurians FD-317 M1]|uniref:Glycosyl transferase family 25 domain-containing protein n=1 Tax=Collybiopsis luxurians FD-317 M1 TaxID=944289 RepID=A0A0D0BCD6_9AGAR|nr:hypothetical protein GYMLUDRAFT_180534 [Collybiopsis luxurians FD-317 M1]